MLRSLLLTSLLAGRARARQVSSALYDISRKRCSDAAQRVPGSRMLISLVLQLPLSERARCVSRRAHASKHCRCLFCFCCERAGGRSVCRTARDILGQRLHKRVCMAQW